MLAAVDTTGEVPDDPGVHGAEEDVAGLGALAQALDVVQQPADLRAGEVAGQREAGLAAEAVLADVAAQLAAERLGAGVLPHQCVVHRLAGVLVPQDGGLALVGDTDRADVVLGQAGLLQRAADDRLHPGPDLGGVVLDVAGLGEDLPVLLLVDGDDPAVGAEDDAAAGGGALVDRGDVVASGGHEGPRLKRLAGGGGPDSQVSPRARVGWKPGGIRTRRGTGRRPADRR